LAKSSVAFRLRQELIAIICPTITIGTPTPTDNQRARAVNGRPAQNWRPTVNADRGRRGPAKPAVRVASEDKQR